MCSSNLLLSHREAVSQRNEETGNMLHTFDFLQRALNPTLTLKG